MTTLAIQGAPPLKRFQQGWTALDGREFGREEAALLFNCHQSLLEYTMDAAGEERKSGFYCILIGDQTSGKTTLLTRLSKQAAFVVKDGVGTKVRTYCMVRYNPHVKECLCSLEYTDPSDGKRKCLEGIPARQLSEEYHKIYGKDAAYDFQNVTRVVVDSPEPTFGLCVMDVMGLTASVPKDQINNLINMQSRLVREELLCPNPNAIGESGGLGPNPNAIGVICTRLGNPNAIGMDKNVKDASWPTHLVKNNLDRVPAGHLIVVITRMDLMQISMVGRKVREHMGLTEKGTAGSRKKIQLTPWTLLMKIKEMFLLDAGLPQSTQVFFVSSFAGSSETLLWEPDAVKRFDQFMNNRNYGEKAIEAKLELPLPNHLSKMLRLLSEEPATWAGEDIEMRDMSMQEQEMFDKFVGSKAVFTYLLRKQLNEPLTRASDVAVDVSQKLVQATNSRRQCERDFRGQEKHKLTADTQSLIREACNRFFTLSVQGGLLPHDEAFDFFNKLEPAFGFSLSEERRLCELLTDGRFPNFPENGNYESPHLMNKESQAGNQLPPSVAGGAAQLTGKSLIDAQKRQMQAQLIEICGGDEASSVNGRNYMLDVLNMRSIRDYYMMLTLYPRQTLDTRALLKRSVGRKDLDVTQALANKIQTDYGRIFYGEKGEGGANLYIATRVALNIYTQMDAAVKTVCYDSGAQNVVKTSQMTELLYSQKGASGVSVDDLKALTAAKKQADAALEDDGGLGGRHDAGGGADGQPPKGGVDQVGLVSANSLTAMMAEQGGGAIDFSQLGGRAGSGSPELIGKNAELLRRSCEHAREELPLELQELSQANCGEARDERGKHFLLSQVMKEREDREEEQSDHGVPRKLPTPWSDIKAVLHFFFYKRTADNLKQSFDKACQGLTQMLNPQTALMMQHMSLMLYQDPGFMSDWMAHYPKSQ